MSTSTFSGPIQSGTVREGASANIGRPLLLQTYTIPSSAILTSPAAVTIARLPAGAKIIEFKVEVVTALVTATNCGLTLGVSGGSATQYQTSVNTGATVGRVAQATLDAALQVANCNNVGTADVAITATPTAATGNASAGAIVVTVKYLQRNSDGS